MYKLWQRYSHITRYSEDKFVFYQQIYKNITCNQVAYLNAKFGFWSTYEEANKKKKREIIFELFWRSYVQFVNSGGVGVYQLLQTTQRIVAKVFEGVNIVINWILFLLFFFGHGFIVVLVNAYVVLLVVYFFIPNH